MKTRKELKEEYKQVKFRMGVFQIRNTINNKIFVGSSTDLAAIWHRNRLQLNFGNHPNEALQKDWNESGADNFVYEIISEIKQSETDDVDYEKEVRLLVELYIEELQPFDELGYNKRPKVK